MILKRFNENLVSVYRESPNYATSNEQTYLAEINEPVKDPVNLT